MTLNSGSGHLNPLRATAKSVFIAHRLIGTPVPSTCRGEESRLALGSRAVTCTPAS